MRTSPALLVLASETDRSAREFVARQAGRGAVLVTPRDLSRPGWYLRVGHPGASVAVAAGRPVAARDIAGVLTRLAAIAEGDLPHIAREDRAYVAAEMTAFLLAFLSSLRARVVNQPTAQCLCGPAWTPAEWRRAARGLGLAAAPVRQRVHPEMSEEAEARGMVVTVIGGTCLDARSPTFAAAALDLARAAGVEVLTVEFAGGPGITVLGAQLVPELARGADQAVLGLFGLREVA